MVTGIRFLFITGSAPFNIFSLWIYLYSSPNVSLSNGSATNSHSISAVVSESLSYAFFNVTTNLPVFVSLDSNLNGLTISVSMFKYSLKLSKFSFNPHLIVTSAL